MVALTSGTMSCLAGDGSTGSDNSLTASNTSGIDVSARAVLQWLSLSGESNGTRLNGSLPGARVNGPMLAAFESESPGTDRTLPASL